MLNGLNSLAWNSCILDKTLSNTEKLRGQSAIQISVWTDNFNWFILIYWNFLIIGNLQYSNLSHLAIIFCKIGCSKGKLFFILLPLLLLHPVFAFLYVVELHSSFIRVKNAIWQYYRMKTHPVIGLGDCWFTKKSLIPFQIMQWDFL